MQSKLTIGITGGIGSGKTTVCRVLRTMGYPVFYSDIIAKEILSSDQQAIEEVKKIFGSNAYTGQNLDRTFLASKIFHNDTLRESLNNIVHPRVRLAFKKWTQEQRADICFNEAAILFETGSYKNFDYNILITAPINKRIDRIMKRDLISKEEIDQRINKQWNDERKVELSDFVIQNDDNQLIIPQIISILNKIKVQNENS